MFRHKLYLEDLDNCLNATIKLHHLQNKTLLITGATGMIGSFIVDSILHANSKYKLGCTVIAMGRNLAKAQARFAHHWNNDKFIFIRHNINHPLRNDMPPPDFVIHSASTTHPVAYATEPISTITTNIFGTYHLLDYLCTNSQSARFVLTSTVEVYGQNRGDIDLFDESYCGYIDCNTLRAGYPESKRLSEALCQAYAKEKGVDYVSARLPRTYGPTMLMSDTKALSQFIKKGLAGEDIVLKSKGDQLFSYAYVADSAAAILSIMLTGKSGAAYNIADSQSDITLRDLAQHVATVCGTKLRYEIPDETESAGFSTANKALLDPTKLKSLGWKPLYTILSGIERTIKIIHKSFE